MSQFLSTSKKTRYELWEVVPAFKPGLFIFIFKQKEHVNCVIEGNMLLLFLTCSLTGEMFLSNYPQVPSKVGLKMHLWILGLDLGRFFYSQKHVPHCFTYTSTHTDFQNATITFILAWFGPNKNLWMCDHTLRLWRVPPFLLQDLSH